MFVIIGMGFGKFVTGGGGMARSDDPRSALLIPKKMELTANGPTQELTSGHDIVSKACLNRPPDAMGNLSLRYLSRDLQVCLIQFKAYQQ